MLAERPKPRREVAPPFHRAWLAAQDDKLAAFEEFFASWLKGLSTFEETARCRLYENQEFHPLDLRHHRAALGELIADGEALALESFKLLNEDLVDQPHVDAHVKLIDQHLAKLTARLHQWHGALEDQADVPESFKSGIRDLEEGKVVDFDKAIKEKP